MFASRLAALVPAAGLACLLATTGAAAQAGDAAAQTYPNRTVRIVVPFPAGGPTDILSRVIAQRLSEVWGQ
ncbi:MAG TPA: tripartite tricarboxylate transporter substrate binding protein, partial [Xanthobacteraceae bacterium]|nr:tripartite tricarboxylate transporter substrate binding protein [Xanthobacteraceae bacterium]